MREIEPPFTIDFNGVTATVKEHEIKEERLFHIDFHGKQKDLVITVGYDRKDQKFWTSIPQGRQEEAEQIGRLIATHIRSKRT